jgi:hypothetical protein
LFVCPVTAGFLLLGRVKILHPCGGDFRLKARSRQRLKNLLHPFRHVAYDSLRNGAFAPMAFDGIGQPDENMVSRIGCPYV